tara:strand:- start:796 stop:1458 length:663 start_codon:yes stop_codon:yes gene_type:complete
MNITYNLKKETNYYGDIRDEIQKLVELNPNQMSFDEYVYLYETINSRHGCNLLVFGLGKDSDLWLNANDGGKTIFLEDNEDWIEAVNVQFSNRDKSIDIKKIKYTDLGYDADRLLDEYSLGTNNLKLNLPEDVRNTEWDIIVVDAPAGYGRDMPCRMKSIYESYNLSNDNHDVDVFVHDAQREIEKMYTEYFFKQYNHIKTFDDGEHGVLQHYRSVNNNE